MEHIPVFSFVACAAAAVALACGCLCLMLALKARAEKQNHLALATEMDGRLATVMEDLEEVSRHAAEQRQRLARLEARDSRLPAEVEFAASAFAAPAAHPAAQPAKQSVTERRHRVLKLAARGLDARTIAETLGVPQGEVALIVGLSKARMEAE
jgi:DNA-binding NarL/FixJ family response regulator